LESAIGSPLCGVRYNPAQASDARSYRREQDLMTKNEVIALGALDSLTGYHLRWASLIFYPDYRKARGIRRGLVGILSVVAANPGINQVSVGKVLLIDAGNLVTLIDGLVKKGLLARTVDPKDRRARSLAITPAGRAELSKTLKLIGKLEARMLAGFSQQERETLLSLLKRIHSAGSSQPQMRRKMRRSVGGRE
jgi:DNA-binding MarR family transcriptional regulator